MPRLFGARRDLVDVLRRADEHAHADALLLVAAFLPVVPAQSDAPRIQSRAAIVADWRAERYFRPAASRCAFVPTAAAQHGA
jgi:hypothetical protein